MSLTITLHDDSEHVAQFSTFTAAMPLLNLFFQDGEDLTTLTKESASKMLPRLLQGLGDADFIRDLANGLLTLFPTLPSDRVWFNDSSRSTHCGVAGLEITEIFLIVAKVLESANNIDTSKLAEYVKDLRGQPMTTPQPVAPKAFKPSRKKNKR